jgi:hypothetical protein
MTGIAALSSGSEANAPTVLEREFRPRALAAAETFGMFVLSVAAFVMEGDVCSPGALKT